MQRILLHVRQTIARIKPYQYLIGPSTVLLIAGFSIFGERSDGLPNGIFHPGSTGAEAATAMLTVFGVITCVSFAVAVYNASYKTEAAAVQSLSLPLSRGERFTSDLIVYLLYLPLVSFAALMITYTLCYFLLTDYALLPAPRYVLPGVAIGWLIHIVITAIWLGPVYMGGRWRWIMGALLVAGYLASDFTGSMITNRTSNHKVEVPYAANLVGLETPKTQYEQADSTAVAVPVSSRFYLTETTQRVNYPGVAGLGVAVLLFYLTAALALNRKTT